MKRFWICLIVLIVLVSMTACGQEAPEAAEKDDPAEPTTAQTGSEPEEAEVPETQDQAADLQSLWGKMEAHFPPMMLLDADMRFNFLGIKDEDCAQCVVLLSDDGMKADELWLLEAVDDEAMERLTQLAQQRMEAKAQETENYAPDQYEIVQKGKVLISGRYLALIVTPEAEQAAELFNEAVG